MKKKKVSDVPEYKKKAVQDLINKMKDNRTVLVASNKSLPGGQFHQIKKKLRGKAEVKVAKKSLVMRAMENFGKESMKELEKCIGADVALFFSKLDAFELSGLLTDNMSPSKAKAGDIAPEDITVEPGPTELVPGPAISELGSVGLKVVVENGKLSIKQGATLVRAGEEINAKVASVLGKLNITPLKVGFDPVGAYDSEDDKVYIGIRIDKEGTLESLREAIAKSLNMSVNIQYINDKTIGYFIAKAGLEGNAFEKLVEEKSSKPEAAAEEKKEEEKTEEAEEGNAEEIKSETQTETTKEGQ